MVVTLGGLMVCNSNLVGFEGAIYDRVSSLNQLSARY